MWSLYLVVGLGEEPYQPFQHPAEQRVKVIEPPQSYRIRGVEWVSFVDLSELRKKEA